MDTSPSIVVALLATCVAGPASGAATGPAPAPATVQPARAPVELGAPRWGRSLDDALAESRRTGRPALILFQEVPGCATCQGFGRGPLSEPLLVEAIETLFVPVAIHNNAPGADAAALARFGEPSWNNPVVRFVDADGKDLIARREGVWTSAGLAPRLVAALDAAGREVPAWLRDHAVESDGAVLEKAVLAMHCFWTGESALGGIDGVVRTKAAFVDGREVVEVTFDPRRLAYSALLEQAAAKGCATVSYVANPAQHEAASALGLKREALRAPLRPAPPSDQSHALGRSPLRLLPLTPGQRTKANAAVAAGRDPRSVLSPRQRELLERVEAALRRSPDALAGLAPPENVAELAAYERTLRASLVG